MVINSQKKLLEMEFETKRHEAVTIVSHVMSSIFQKSYNDLMVVKNSNEFAKYINNATDQTLQDMELMFYRVASSKPDFVQLRFINAQGFEVARVNKKDGETIIVPKDELQDKSDVLHEKRPCRTLGYNVYFRP